MRIYYENLKMKHEEHMIGIYKKHEEECWLLKRKHEEHLKRMAELRSQYLDDNTTELPEELLDENSQSGNPTKMKKKWGDVSQTELAGGVYNPLAHVTAETLFEYKWPLEGRHSEHYFLQEQVTEYLDAKSFKRKYPDCPRRTISMEERDFLIDMKIVNETQADLGLTAIPSAYMLDIMSADFYEFIGKGASTSRVEVVEGGNREKGPQEGQDRGYAPRSTRIRVQDLEKYQNAVMAQY